MSDGPVVFVLGDCLICRRRFLFHPFRVPSITWKGSREPVCADCMERFNRDRVAHGLPRVEPLAGAYEPADESEWINGDDDV